MGVLGYVLGALLLIGAGALTIEAREDIAEAGARWRACVSGLPRVGSLPPPLDLTDRVCGRPEPRWNLATLSMAANAGAAGLAFLMLGAGLRRGERLEAKLDQLAVAAGRPGGDGAEAQQEARLRAVMETLNPERVRQHAEMIQHVARLRGLDITAEEAERQARETLARRETSPG